MSDMIEHVGVEYLIVSYLLSKSNSIQTDNPDSQYILHNVHYSSFLSL